MPALNTYVPKWIHKLLLHISTCCLHVWVQTMIIITIVRTSYLILTHNNSVGVAGGEHHGLDCWKGKSILHHKFQTITNRSDIIELTTVILMEISSASLTVFAGNSQVTAEFPSQRLVTRSFDVFFDLPLKKWFDRQSQSWWLETPLRSL